MSINRIMNMTYETKERKVTLAFDGSSECHYPMVSVRVNDTQVARFGAVELFDAIIGYIAEYTEHADFGVARRARQAVITQQIARCCARHPCGEE